MCAQFMRWLGADVRKTEPAADGLAAALRRSTSFADSLIAYADEGKEAIAAPPGPVGWARALEGVDVFVTDRSVAELQAIGLPPERLTEVAPRLILVSITGYGLTGPRAGRAASEMTSYHAGGEGYLLPGDPVYSEYPDRPPVRGGRFLADYDAALCGLVGALGALVGRERSGRGDVVEVSAQEVELGLNRTTLSRCFYEGRDIDRGDRGYDYGGLIRCADGWITLRPTEDDQWRSFARAIGHGELAEDDRFATRAARDRNGAELTVVLEEWSRTRGTAEIREILLESNCPGGPFFEPAEVLADPVLGERGLFQPVAGGRAPLRLFQATEEVEVGDAPAPPAGESGPLAGMRVIDFTWVAAGPYATELLSFLGAEVIKIESRRRPDLFRRLVGGGTTDLDSSIRFVDLNQNKRSICLDLKDPDDRRRLLELAESATLVVDNFRPGVLERLGLGPAAMREVNPRLVSVSLSGFGATGRMVDRPGYASVFNAESGLGAMTGYGDGPPTEIRDSNDLRAGMASAAAALAGTLRAVRDGVAGSYDVAAREVVIALQGDATLQASVGDEAPHRDGNRLGDFTPHDCYRAADGDWVAVAVRLEREWEGLRSVVEGLPDAPPDERPAHRAEIERAVERWVGARSSPAAVEALAAAGVPAAISAPAGVLHSDPHLNARGFFAVDEHERLGEVVLIGSPIRYWGATPPTPRAAPMLDEMRAEMDQADEERVGIER
jgi:crotonobetainyl-CoA:carnitine CoA-transferase CaiB-like acyl-CoA transferase